MVVLIVDDSKYDHMFVARALATPGADQPISIAENGLIALQILDEGLAPDVILLDSKMPSANGQSFLRKLKTTEDWRYIPIVMLSGPDNTNECLDLQAKEFIVKSDTVQGYNEAGKRIVSKWLEPLEN